MPAPNEFAHSCTVVALPLATTRAASLAIALVAFVLAARAHAEPEGVLIYHEPLASYTEAFEYQSFRQDNALYSTAITTKNERKKLKSGGVLALVPYPPAAFDSFFQGTAEAALHKIGSLEATYPQLKSPLEIARGKWARALTLFQQTEKTSSTPSAARTEQRAATLAPGAHLTSASADSATITHATGVSTIPLSDLSPQQILSLNATSRAIQLPLGIQRVTRPAPTPVREGEITGRIEGAGRRAIAFSAEKLGIADTTFSVWTFFVIFPTLVFLLLGAVILMARRPRLNELPQRRPLS